MSLRGPDPGERPAGGRAAAGGLLRRWRLPGAGVLVLLVVGAGVWAAHGGGDSAADVEPPLIKADGRPTKYRPEDPGGWRAPHQDKLVYETLLPGPPAPGAERLLPGPEEPLAKPTPPPAPQPDPAAAQASAPEPAAPEAETEGAVEVAEATAIPLPGQGGPAAPPPPAAGPQELAAPPASEPAPPPAAPANPEPQPTKVAAAPSGGFRLQLAAFQDRAAADATWRRLQRAHPAVLGGLEPRIVAADLGPKGTWYRLQAAGLSSEAAARAACELLKSRKQDCLVVKPG